MSSPPPRSEGQEDMAFEGSTSCGLHGGQRGLGGSWPGAGRSPREARMTAFSSRAINHPNWVAEPS